MTEGHLFKKILLYTVPIILSGILQLLFNAVDLIVVGHFCGDVALASVGATSSLINLITNLFIGLSVGAGITVARALGERRADDVSDAVHTAMPIAVISGAILTVVGMVFSETFLKLMDTPDSVIGGSTLYMRIYFGGIIFSMVYNFGAAILRATGDTQSPLVYLAVAGLVNAGLNVLFVTAFDMTVDGVAYATVISQAISAVLVVANLIRRHDECRFSPRRMRINRRALINIARIGLPSGIQGSLFSISNVLIQSSINSFGDAAISGSTAAGSIEGFVYTSMNSFSHTTQNFVSQNRGAEKFDRIRKTVLISVGMVTVIGISLGLLVFALRYPLLSIYLKESTEAVDYAISKLFYVGVFYFLCGIMDSLSGAIRGLGSSTAPMLVSLVGVCGIRVLWIYTVFQIPEYHTFSCLCISYPITWTITALAHATLFTVLFLHERKKSRLRAAESAPNEPTKIEV